MQNLGLLGLDRRHLFEFALFNTMNEAASNIYFSPFTHPVQLFNTRLTNVLQLFKITGGNDKQGFPMKQGGMFALITNTTRRPN